MPLLLSLFKLTTSIKLAEFFNLKFLKSSSFLISFFLILCIIKEEKTGHNLRTCDVVYVYTWFPSVQQIYLLQEKSTGTKMGCPVFFPFILQLVGNI